MRVKNPPRGAKRETVAEHLSDAYLRASPDDTLDAIAARLAEVMRRDAPSARIDPAHGSGPIATVVQDTLSIVSYFLVLQLFGV